MSKTVIILGATGAIGQEIATQLREKNYRVVVTGRNALKLEKIFEKSQYEFLVLDAMDREQMARITADADYVFNCINPPYDQWEKYWPTISKNIVYAMHKNQFKHVYIDNVYSYGRIVGEKLVSQQPMRPVGKKGKIKKRIINDLQQEEEIWKNTVIAQFPDFLGPTVNNGFFENFIIYPMQGKKPSWLFNDKVPHSFIYTKDAAEAAIKLGLDHSSYGRKWIVSGDESPSGKEFFEIVSSLLSRKSEYRVLKRWQIHLIGIFIPIVKEFLENYYQWNEPFILDNREFLEKYPEFSFMSLRKAVQETMTRLSEKEP